MKKKNRGKIIYGQVKFVVGIETWQWALKISYIIVGSFEKALTPRFEENDSMENQIKFVDQNGDNSSTNQ